MLKNIILLASTVPVAEWFRTLVGGAQECVQSGLNPTQRFDLSSFPFFVEIFLAGYRHHANILAAGSLRFIFQCRCRLSSHTLLFNTHFNCIFIINFE